MKHAHPFAADVTQYFPALQKALKDSYSWQVRLLAQNLCFEQVREVTPQTPKRAN